MEMIIMHGQAVAHGLNRTIMVIDMPFARYEEKPAQAFRNADRLEAETGAGTVKLEDGVERAETIRFLVKRGIPVMAHIGLTPQSINTLGGYKVQGCDKQAESVRIDARAVTRAFSGVLEKVPQGLADQIIGEILTPTIGIGTSAGCDGQILVVNDMLGFFNSFKPKFVRRYANLGPQIEPAIAEYATVVRTSRFPADEHVFVDQNLSTAAKL